jgi:hypothetical protein
MSEVERKFERFLMSGKRDKPVDRTKRKVRGTFTYGIDGSVKYIPNKELKTKNG